MTRGLRMVEHDAQVQLRVLLEIGMTCGLGMLQSLLLAFQAQLAGTTAEGEVRHVCEMPCLVSLHIQ